MILSVVVIFIVNLVSCYWGLKNTEDFLVFGTNTEQLFILDVVSEDWEVEINESSKNL